MAKLAAKSKSSWMLAVSSASELEEAGLVSSLTFSLFRDFDCFLPGFDTSIANLLTFKSAIEELLTTTDDSASSTADFLNVTCDGSIAEITPDVFEPSLRNKSTV